MQKKEEVQELENEYRCEEASDKEVEDGEKEYDGEGEELIENEEDVKVVEENEKEPVFEDENNIGTSILEETNEDYTGTIPAADINLEDIPVFYRVENIETESNKFSSWGRLQ